jgi:DNA polymerase-3 subunit alpha
MLDFTHLHVHSQFSILDGAASLEGLLARTSEMGMDAMALTDHGNLFGLLKFFRAARKEFNIKPILGCEIMLPGDQERRKLPRSTGADII